MENVNVRRSFLKGFGLLGAAAGGFLAAQNSFANTPPPSPIGSPTVTERDNGPIEDIAHLAPLGSTTLRLQANNELPKRVEGNGYVVMTGMWPSEDDNKVILSVGKDNRLWIKVDDTWRRVALEG